MIEMCIRDRYGIGDPGGDRIVFDENNPTAEPQWEIAYQVSSKHQTAMINASLCDYGKEDYEDKACLLYTST